MYRDLVAKMREQAKQTIAKPFLMPAIIDKTKRRSMEGMAPVSQDFIRLLVDKVGTIEYDHSVIGGLSPLEQQQRNKSLISLLYLSARRISEIVGRTYKGFIHEGVKLNDFREDKLEGREVLIMNCLILKKWRRKADEPKIVRKDMIMDMSDAPFIEHIQAWREHQRESGKEKFMPITRSRAYQILQQIDQRIVGPHWFRHMRLSHLAETLNPFQLNERIGFWERIDQPWRTCMGRSVTIWRHVRTLAYPDISFHDSSLFMSNR